MKGVHIGVCGLVALAVAACAPETAKQARGDLRLTAGAAQAASTGAMIESATVGAAASDIMIDVTNIKDIEAWFDQRRPVSFD